MQFGKTVFLALSVLVSSASVSNAQDAAVAQVASIEAPAIAPGALMPARVEGVAQVGDLARRQSDLAIAKLDAEIAVVRSQLAAPEQGGLVSAAAPSLPLTVVAVHGTVDSPYAVVRAGAGTSIIREGSKLEDGAVVDNITTSRVTVRRSGRFQDLPFASGSTGGAPMGGSGAFWPGSGPPGSLPVSPAPLTPPIPSLFGAQPRQAVAPPAGQQR